MALKIVRESGLEINIGLIVLGFQYGGDQFRSCSFLTPRNANRTWFSSITVTDVEYEFLWRRQPSHSAYAVTPGGDDTFTPTRTSAAESQLRTDSLYPLTFYTEITSALALPHSYLPSQQTKYAHTK